MDRWPRARLAHGGGWGWRIGGMVHMRSGSGLLRKMGKRGRFGGEGILSKRGVLWLKQEREGRRAERVARKLLAWGKHPGMTTRPLVCFEGSILCMHALFWFCFWCLLFYLSCQCLMLCFLPWAWCIKIIFFFASFQWHLYPAHWSLWNGAEFNRIFFICICSVFLHFLCFVHFWNVGYHVWVGYETGN